MRWSMTTFHPLHTLRLAARGLIRVPGTALTAVLTLGIGLTAAVVILGIHNAATRPLPVPEGAQVVQVRLFDASARPTAYPPGRVDAWAVGPGVQDAGGVRIVAVRLRHAEAPAMNASGAAMDPSVFRLLRVAPALGRVPTEDPADAAAVVLGWSVWQELGADPALLGTRIDVDGRPHTIIGVMPDGFGFPERQSFWTVLPPGEAPGEVVARLAPGVEPAAAARAMEARLREAAVSAGAAAPERVQLRLWTSSRGDGDEAAVFGGLAAVVALLLIVCSANVATLLLVRATERASVLAVHAALGAPRLQIGSQLFAEALLIAVGGGAVGLLGGSALLRWMELNLSQHWGYFWMSMEVRPPVLAGTFAAVLAVAVLAGTAPALRAMGTDLRSVLGGAGRGVSGRGARRLGRWFVGAQAALSTLGLIVAVFLAWGAAGLGRWTAGLPLDRVAVAAVSPPADRYGDAARVTALAAELRSELLSLAGARAASVSSGVPGFDGASAPLHVQGRPTDDATAPRAVWIAADPGFLDTYGIRVLSGRALSNADAAGAPPVVLVTASFSRRFLGGTGVGTRLRLEGVHGADQWAEVVGVVADWYPDEAGARADRVIVPLAQASVRRLFVSVRGDGDAAPLAGALPAAIARVDPDLPAEMPGTLGSLVAWLTRMPRTIAGFGILGGLASVLVAAIGLYGVTAFQVRARLPEIGVRMALGADRRRISREVLAEGLRRAAPGLTVGALLGVPIGRALGTFNSGMSAPTTLLLVAALAGMLAVALLAALIPARSAARLDPQAVLRSE